MDNSHDRWHIPPGIFQNDQKLALFGEHVLRQTRIGDSPEALLLRGTSSSPGPLGGFNHFDLSLPAYRSMKGENPTLQEQLDFATEHGTDIRLGVNTKSVLWVEGFLPPEIKVAFWAICAQVAKELTTCEKCKGPKEPHRCGTHCDACLATLLPEAA
jgi:hypothetical protein